MITISLVLLVLTTGFYCAPILSSPPPHLLTWKVTDTNSTYNTSLKRDLLSATKLDIGLTNNSTTDVLLEPNAELNPNLFEGDIKLLEDSDNRNALRSSSYHWPNAIVPFTISSRLPESNIKYILEAISDMHKYTCVKWIPRTTERNYVDFMSNDDGCWSYVGRIGGKQDIALERRCPGKGTSLHEMMHALGFFHEQSRTDRDNYVVIHWNNIIRGLEDQFQKMNSWEENNLGTAYDLGSVLHYRKTAFTSNGKPTIEPKDRNAVIGQRLELSENDITKINRLYKCSETTIGSPLVVPTSEGCLDAGPSAFCAKIGSYNEGCRIYHLSCKATCRACYSATTTIQSTTAVSSSSVSSAYETSTSSSASTSKLAVATSMSTIQTTTWVVEPVLFSISTSSTEFTKEITSPDLITANSTISTSTMAIITSSASISTPRLTIGTTTTTVPETTLSLTKNIASTTSIMTKSTTTTTTTTTTSLSTAITTPATTSPQETCVDSMNPVLCSFLPCVVYSAYCAKSCNIC